MGTPTHTKHGEDCRITVIRLITYSSGIMADGQNFLPVVLVALALSCASSSGDIQNMEKFHIVPDMISSFPPAEVTVTYDGDLEAQQGNELAPTKVQKKPKIGWPVEEDTYYTLIAINPDVPASFGGNQALFWVIVNVPGDDVIKGEAIFDYIGSIPPEDSGFHRYIFLVYKQPGIFEKSKYEDIQDVQYISRLSYTLNYLLDKFDFQDPIAGNFFIAQFDENVPKYRALMMENYEKRGL